MQRAGQEALFGRLPSCEVPLDHLSVSRAHAQLSTDGAGNLFLTDMGSGEQRSSGVAGTCVGHACLGACQKTLLRRRRPLLAAAAGGEPC